MASNQFVEALAATIDLDDLEWLWLTVDPDHVDAVARLHEAAPQLKVVTSFLGMGKLGILGIALPPERARRARGRGRRDRRRGHGRDRREDDGGARHGQPRCTRVSGRPRPPGWICRLPAPGHRSTARFRRSTARSRRSTARSRRSTARFRRSTARSRRSTAPRLRSAAGSVLQEPGVPFVEPRASFVEPGNAFVEPGSAFVELEGPFVEPHRPKARNRSAARGYPHSAHPAGCSRPSHDRAAHPRLPLRRPLPLRPVVHRFPGRPRGPRETRPRPPTAPDRPRPCPRSFRCPRRPLRGHPPAGLLHRPPGPRLHRPPKDCAIQIRLRGWVWP